MHDNTNSIKMALNRPKLQQLRGYSIGGLPWPSRKQAEPQTSSWPGRGLAVSRSPAPTRAPASVHGQQLGRSNQAGPCQVLRSPSPPSHSITCFLPKTSPVSPTHDKYHHHEPRPFSFSTRLSLDSATHHFSLYRITAATPISPIHHNFTNSQHKYACFVYVVDSLFANKNIC